MSNLLKEVVHLLSCPDDGEELVIAGRGLGCQVCGRFFPAVTDNYVEILPKQPVSLPLSVNEDYRNSYLQLFHETLDCGGRELAWGAEEAATASWMRKRLRQVNMVSQLIREGTDPVQSVLCDFSGGAGHYTRSYAPYFRWVLHCDLSAGNLHYCRKKSATENCNNIFFMRIDYFNPPFRHSLDRVLCLDTIIRGEEHDRLLLQSIVRCMNLRGRAIIDFHNWWHNPLRRIGLLGDNFISNKSYSRRSAESLLKKIGVGCFLYRPFRQEFESASSAGWYKRLIPPTRLIYSVGSSSLLS